MPPVSAQPGLRPDAAVDRERPIERELDVQVPDGFTLVVMGDLILSRPVAPILKRDPGFARVVDIIRRADVAFGNLEIALVDIRDFEGHPMVDPSEGFLIAATPEVAADLKSLGFDIVGRANNHALDWGIEGLRQTTATLDAAGLVHAGAGANLAMARLPAFMEGERVRIGLVSLASTFSLRADALDPADGGPARAGINPLRVTTTTILPPDAFAAKRQLRDRLFPSHAADKPVKLFGATFGEGASLGYRYDIDAADLAANLRAIRGGKQLSGFLVAAIHSHESSNMPSPEPASDALDRPADFLQTAARAAIDAGASVWVTTGIHHVGGIEVYKGRPIFYGLGNAFWDYGNQAPQPSDMRQQSAAAVASAFEFPGRATTSDWLLAADGTYFANDETFESVLAETRWAGGRVAEIRLYPVELGRRAHASVAGIPRPAGRVRGERILARIADQSRAYGTVIAVRNDPVFGVIGVITPPRAASAGPGD